MQSTFTAKIDNIYNLSIEAVYAYVDGNRVMGNSLLAETRRDIVQVDEALLRIVELQILSAEEAKERALDAIDVTIENADDVIARVYNSVAAADQLYQSAEFMTGAIGTTSKRASSVSQVSSKTSEIFCL